jgi:glutamine cyclotransferase
LKGLALLLLLWAPAVAGAVESLAWELLGKLPHSRSDFVQGLEIRNGRLYQGTGLHGRSRLQVFDLQTGKLLRERALPRQYFGEGITVLGSRVIQLTWQARKALIFRRADLRPMDSFPLPGEGWGLTNDGRQLIYSDGSHILRFVSPGDWKITGSLPVLREGKPVNYLNELEWTSVGLFANVWGQDLILRIDPASGEVTGELDLEGLLPRSERRPGTDVLNGIAHNPEDGTFWVTGKNWPWLYQIRLCPPDCTARKTPE